MKIQQMKKFFGFTPQKQLMVANKHHLYRNILEKITNDENFPDPDFYYIGLNKNMNFLSQVIKKNIITIT